MTEELPLPQVHIENIFTYVVNIAIATVASAILFRARNVSLNLVKILCPLLILQQLAFCGARALLYQQRLNIDGSGKVYLVSYAAVAAFCLCLLNLVHWIYAFKIWLLSKKIEWDIQKKKSLEQNTKCYSIIYILMMCLILVGGICFGVYLWFDTGNNDLIWVAFLFDFAFTPELVAVVFLLLAMRSIRKSLQNHQNAFPNINAMRAHNASFCMYGSAIALKMISLTIDSMSKKHQSSKFEEVFTMVLFFVILSLNFVSLVILLYIFNGLVTIELNRLAEKTYDPEILMEDRPTTLGGQTTYTSSS
jgi:hypothetical protein